MAKEPGVSFASLELPPRESTAVAVARRLLDYLRSGQVGAGQRIPSERQLALVLDVGRSTVREAVQALALLGLVEVRQGDGTYYRGVVSGVEASRTEWSILLGPRPSDQVIEARDQFAVLFAGLAAVRGDNTVVGEIQAVVDDLGAHENDPAAAAAVAASFRLLLAKASGNDILHQIVSTIEALSGGMAAPERDGETTDKTRAAYQAVVAGIARRDALAARSAMEAIVATTWSEVDRAAPPTASA
ncbi:MAG: FadR family transcriptional regulator [Chloroflexia bacterium]|nr:FadR family transcriptional regulator [Chloroflexia bacterium]